MNCRDQRETVPSSPSGVGKQETALRCGTKGLRLRGPRSHTHGPATSLAPRRPMGHECHHRRARPSPGGVGRMESGDRAVSVQGGMARSTQAGQGQEMQLCSTDGKDKTTRRDGAKKPQLEAAPGSWVEPRNLGPAESPSPHRWLCVVPISADSLILAQADMPMPGADTLLGPRGLPVIVSVPGWWTLPPQGLLGHCPALQQ